MGRKKISITRLTDERNRQITFSKRKAGLLKKAYELSILCDVEIAVIMITSNNKLYQYASSNMNSILIRYTDFKDPDENKTNADILDDITKKEKGAAGQEDSGDDESSSQSFMVTPRTQENFRRIDKEFDTLLRTNQVPQNQSLPRAMAGMPANTPLGSAPPSIPSVMPVTVPVGYSPNTVQKQIQQHLQGQLDTQRSSGSSGLASAPLNSASTGSLFSPQSDLSSGSPMSRPHRSPTSMPPPMTTPTRLQTLRNQTLKLHLPGSGRNYISLPTSGSGSGGGGDGSMGKKLGAEGGAEGEEPGEVAKDGASGEGSTHPGAKPQLRVYIPGQKEFVPKTQDASPLTQVSLTTQAAVGGAVAVGVSSSSSSTTQVTTTTTESLTTPVLSLTTPNIFSSLPPIFSSLIGDFPFGQPSATGTGSTGGVVMGGASATTTTGGGGGGGGDASGDKSSAALVAFPVSIQPSATSGGAAGGSNLILQAQNMGQPFLLTPTYDSRQNPLFSSQGYTPPTSGLAAGLSPGIGAFQNLEQLKQQYEMTQQMIQQQLLYTKMQLLQQQQGTKEGGRAEEGGSGRASGGVGGVGGGAATVAASIAGTTAGSGGGLAAHHHPEGVLRSEGDEGGSSQYLNGSDVMMGLHSQSSQAQSRSGSSSGGGSGGSSGGSTGRTHPHDDSIAPPESKRSRLGTSDSVQ